MDILNSSSKMLLPLKHEGREGSEALGEGGLGSRPPGKALEGTQPGGLPARGGMLTQGSPPTRQGAASQVQIVLLITEGLAASQDQGGQFQLLMGKDKQARRDPCQAGDGSWQDLRPRAGTGVLNQKEPMGAAQSQ